MGDLVTRFKAVNIELPNQRAGPCQYRILGHSFQLKNMAGRLVVRKGGGYHDLIDVVEKLRLVYE